MRCSTGGSLPALTSSASCGASLKRFGNWAGSVMSSGPSSLPIRCAPGLAPWAPAGPTGSCVAEAASRPEAQHGAARQTAVRPLGWMDVLSVAHGSPLSPSSTRRACSGLAFMTTGSQMGDAFVAFLL